MTRTFSKLFGLAALRLGWLYAPPDVIDVLHRVRGPFNVSALAADRRHRSTRGPRASGARARQQRPLADRGSRSSCRASAFACTRASPISSWSSFADGARSAPAASAWLERQGILARPMAAYGLPQCLRISVGHEAENQAVVAAPARVRGVSAPGPAPRFERVALIGIGLINGSLALNLRAARPGRRDRRLRAARGDARAAPGAGPCRSDHDRPRGRGRGRRPRRGRHAARLRRRGRRGDGARPRAGRDRHRRQLDQGRGRPRAGAGICRSPRRVVGGHPVAGTEHSGPDAAFADAVPAAATAS